MMQVGGFANFPQRQSGFARLLEGLPPCLAGFPGGALELPLSASNSGASFGLFAGIGSHENRSLDGAAEASPQDSVGQTTSFIRQPGMRTYELPGNPLFKRFCKRE
jgi:hypothetical protein